MAQMTKAKKAKKRKKLKNNKIKKMEKEDSLGISRKKIEGVIPPSVYVILKIIGIVLIPLFYFIYSPLLILAVLYNVILIVFTKMCEKYMNRSYIKSSHIKLLRFDSVIAIIVLLITFAGFIISFNTKKKIPNSNLAQEIQMKAENLGSCLTGNRVLFGDNKGMHFGTKDMPKDMPKPNEKRDFKEFGLDDLPVEAIFSQMVSSINTILIFMIPITNFVTLIIFKRKKKKFDKNMNEIITDSYANFSEEKLDELFSFGLELKE